MYNQGVWCGVSLPCFIPCWKDREYHRDQLLGNQELPYPFQCDVRWRCLPLAYLWIIKFAMECKKVNITQKQRVVFVSYYWVLLLGELCSLIWFALHSSQLLFDIWSRHRMINIYPLIMYHTIPNNCGKSHTY